MTSLPSAGPRKSTSVCPNPWCVPAETVSSLRENVGALDVRLTEGDIKELDEIVNGFKAVGDRWVAGSPRAHCLTTALSLLVQVSSCRKRLLE